MSAYAKQRIRGLLLQIKFAIVGMVNIVIYTTAPSCASYALERGVNLRRHPSLGNRVAMILGDDIGVRTSKIEMLCGLLTGLFHSQA